MSDLAANVAMGFGVALIPLNLFYCFLGVTIGTLVGVLPGVGPLVTIAVLMPMTFGLGPETALMMLAGIYYGAQYGGSTTAILVNLPGESSSVITCLDGHAMARQGRAGAALAIAAIGSLIAGIFGTVLIIVAGPPLAEVGLQFQAPDYFSLMVLALCATAALVHGSMLKGGLMALLGILIGLVGTDVNTGVMRFTFGASNLIEGVSFPVIAIGFFAISEIITGLYNPESRGEIGGKLKSIWPTREDFRQSWFPIARGTALGSFFGLLPGTGPSISTFAAYMLEKRVSRTPEAFGKGAIAGVAAPEAANNAAAQTSFIPTLTLGIPGSATMALFLGALTIHGITPGPRVITSHPQLFWGLIASMFIGNVMLVVLNLPLVGLWASFLRVPYRWLYLGILMLSCAGVYAFELNAQDLLLVAFFGVLGHILRRLDCEPAPFVLGFVLGPLLEENFRRALIVGRSDPMVFLSRPISTAFLVAAAIILLTLTLPKVRRSKEKALEGGGG